MDLSSPYQQATTPSLTGTEIENIVNKQAASLLLIQDETIDAVQISGKPAGWLKSNLTTVA